MSGVDGLLLLDKPAGPTSFEVVRRVRRWLKVRKVGHLGTLDPFATGLLPLALGEATKLSPFLMEADKTYLAVVKLGEETDTQDLTGRVVAKSDRLPEPREVIRAAARFVGEIEQTPPLYSAVHYQGQRLYKLARQGLAVAPPPRRVVIHCLEVQDIALPEVTLLVVCGKGTYIRTLAADLGRALGCGAHLKALRRLAVGPFRVEEALPLADLEFLSREELAQRLIPLADCLPGLKPVAVAAGEAERLSRGQAVPVQANGLAEGELVRVLEEGRLLAVAAVQAGERQTLLAPKRVFHRGRQPGDSDRPPA
ncbi:MAG: tRNA pseudouridine(55) synthase TruB [Deltaproteobacteria bacterium]|nr:tRNA pseudouridine(55) synthase TruB [Deltaproteobacteria bacterium]